MKVQLADGTIAEFPDNTPLADVQSAIDGWAKKNAPESINQGQPSWWKPVRETIEGLGYAGAVAGPPGAALGVAASKNIAQNVGEMLGYEKPTSLPDKFLQAGMGALEGATGEMGTQIAGKAIPPVFNKVMSKLPLAAKGTGPKAQVIQSIANREGVHMMPPDITGNLGQAQIISAESKLPGSANTMQREAAKSIRSYAEYSNRIREMGSPVNSPFLTGQTVKEGATLTKSQAENIMNDMYQKAYDMGAKDIPVTFKNWALETNKIQEMSDYRLLPKQYKEQVQDVLKIIAEEKNTVKPGLTSYPDWSYSKAEDLRRSMMSRIISTDDKTAKRLMTKAYEAFEKDMEASAMKAGSDVHQMFKDAREFAKQNFYGPFGRGSEGEKIAKYSEEHIMEIMKTTSGLKKIKDIIPGENFQSAKEGILAEMFENASRKVKVMNTEVVIINPAQLDRSLNAYKKEYLRELLSREEKQILDDYIKVGRSMNTSDKIAGNPSGSAGTWWMMNLLTGGIGFAAGGIKGAAVTNLGLVGAPYVLAKILNSPAGREYMINGIRLGREQVAKYARPVIATQMPTIDLDTLLGRKKEEPVTIRGAIQ